MDGPGEIVRKQHGSLPVVCAAPPAQRRTRSIKINTYVGAQLPRQPYGNSCRGVDGVDDRETTSGRVESRRTAVSCRGIEAQVAVVLRSPALCRLALDVTAQRGGTRVGVPQKRTSRLSLADAPDLYGVVRCRRAEPLSPHRLSVVAVGARVSKDIDAVMPHLQRKGIGMGVSCDGEESMWAAVASAPDLWAVLGSGPQDDQPSVGESTWPAPRSWQLTRLDQGRLRQWPGRRPGIWATSRAHLTMQSPAARIAPHGSRSGSSTMRARPSSPSPCLGGRPLASRMAAAASSIRVSRSQVASESGCPPASASTARHQSKFEDESVVVRREFTVETVVEGVGRQLAFQELLQRCDASGRCGNTRETRRQRQAAQQPRQLHGC